jgi:hypothetical protein
MRKFKIDSNYKKIDMMVKDSSLAKRIDEIDIVLKGIKSIPTSVYYSTIPSPTFAKIL